MGNELVNNLSLEARSLMANITLNEREIDQLIKTNCTELDAYFVMNLKNEFLQDYTKGYEEIIGNEVAVDHLFYWCTCKAYSRGYESALRQYSSIVMREIVNAVKGGVV